MVLQCPRGQVIPVTHCSYVPNNSTQFEAFPTVLPVHVAYGQSSSTHNSARYKSCAPSSSFTPVGVAIGGHVLLMHPCMVEGSCPRSASACLPGRWQCTCLHISQQRVVGSSSSRAAIRTVSHWRDTALQSIHLWRVCHTPPFKGPVNLCN